ncbi:MAG TPA: type II secretion system F family protein, partial [Anaerohalosphaeraceae bacterium]|nr:type II secretion system F family protein [Anaerohalosphaeraceae bacterium]
MFQYKGIDAAGRPIAGSIEAVDRKAAIAELAGQGCFVRQIQESALDAAGTIGTIQSGISRSGIKAKDILAMTAQLATALEAGLPMFSALEILKSQQKKAAMLNLLNELTGAVSSGQSLSEALGRHPNLFSSLYLSMVRVGETGGILEKTMQQLVGLMSREEKIRSNLISASAYPLFVLSAGLISMVIILVWVLPRIIRTIGIDPSMLPLPTRMLMGFSHFLLAFGWLAALGIGFAVYCFIRWKRTPGGRMTWDSFKLKLPLFGNVVRSLAVSEPTLRAKRPTASDRTTLP